MGLVLIVLLVLALDFCQEESDIDQSVSFKDSHSYSYSMGEIADLDSREDDEGSSYSWYAGFSWFGTLAVTVDKFDVYQKNDIDGSDLFEEEMFASDLSDWSDSMVLIVATLDVKNIDAQPSVDDHSFLASVFSMPDSISYVPTFVDFGNAALKNATEKDFYRFYIAPGEEERIRIGWLVEEEYLSHDAQFFVGATGTEKYAFTIPLKGREEG